MKGVLLMTPGPTYINERVRNALAQPITNPDLDISFFEFYRETCAKLQQLMGTQNEVLVLAGEGILGLEAACASLIEPGDRVLCIDNGIFGRGFGDFVKLYGGEPVYFSTDYRRGIDVEALQAFLKQDHDFKLATLVHCETPTGITNPVDKICPLLKQYDILTVVDAVSAIGGEIIKVDEWQIDMALGGSQKALSAPPGLTFLSISEAAWQAMEKRKTPIRSFYLNLTLWQDWYEKKWFPYTQSISDIYALHCAVELALADENLLTRHARIAAATRKALTQGGIELYPRDHFSNTLTAAVVPEGVTFADIYNKMLMEHRIMIAGSLGDLNGKVFRIGHMGENCYEDKVYLTLKALDKVLRDLGVELKQELHKTFVEAI